MARRKTARHRLPDQTALDLLDRLTERRKTLGSFRIRANERRTIIERAADRLTGIMGSAPFLIFHIGLFFVWITYNLHLLPVGTPYDPFPFGLLTLAMTLEQSLLTIFIIMSQNRTADISDLRNEIDLQINMVAEEEISKALKMLRLIGEHLEIAEIMNDPEIRVMEKSLDHAQIEKQMMQELTPAPKEPEPEPAKESPMEGPELPPPAKASVESSTS
ncbi:MAG: DUF1003 domain-containing protein [Chloroflexota bacterium]